MVVWHLENHNCSISVLRLPPKFVGLPVAQLRCTTQSHSTYIFSKIFMLTPVLARIVCASLNALLHSWLQLIHWLRLYRFLSRVIWRCFFLPNIRSFCLDETPGWCLCDAAIPFWCLSFFGPFRCILNGLWCFHRVFSRAASCAPYFLPTEFPGVILFTFFRRHVGFWIMFGQYIIFNVFTNGTSGLYCY